MEKQQHLIKEILIPWFKRICNFSCLCAILMVSSNEMVWFWSALQGVAFRKPVHWLDAESKWIDFINSPINGQYQHEFVTDNALLD